MRKLLALWFLLAVAAAPASAQDYKPVDVFFGFGWAFPTTDFKNSFDAGWNGTIGATYNINANLGVQADYTYTHMNGPERTISLSATPTALATSSGVLQSNHQMHIGTFDLIYKIQRPDALVHGYVLGGLGIYHRIVQITTPSVGYTTFCDPFWYACYPALVSVDQIVGDHPRMTSASTSAAASHSAMPRSSTSRRATTTCGARRLTRSRRSCPRQRQRAIARAAAPRMRRTSR